MAVVPLSRCTLLIALLLLAFASEFLHGGTGQLSDVLGIKKSSDGAIASHSTGSDDQALDQRRREKRWDNYYGGGGGLLVSSEMPNEWLRTWIISEHNRYRRMIPAMDMRMMYWSDELAASAQRHADTCDFRHSRNRVNIGENIWAAPHYNYSQALSIWYNEVNNPYCGCGNGYKHCCGHYIQLVWARTSLVGCGFARCRDIQGVFGFGHRAVFVCHYNPQGNKVHGGWNGQLYAVPAYTYGQRCGNCPSDAPGCYDGLCYMPANYVPPQSPVATSYGAALARNSVLDQRR